MASWKDLPDVKPAASWKDLPTVDAVPPASPLAAAMKAQTGDLVTVDTPTGPAQFDRQGNRVLTHNETTQAIDDWDAQGKVGALSNVVALASGGTHGLLDRAAGVVDTIKGAPGAIADAWNGKETPGIADMYAKNRDANRKTIDAAVQQGPKVAGVPVFPVVGEVMTSGPAAESIPARLAVNTALGGVSAFGNSRAKDGEEQAQDTAAGAGMGLLVGGVGEALAAPFGALARKAEGAAAVGRVGAEVKEMGKLTGKVSSLNSSAGGETSAAIRALQLVDDVVAHPERYDDIAKAFAARMANDPEIVALRSNAAVNSMSQLKNRVGNIGSFKEMAEQAGENIPERAAQAAAESIADAPNRLWEGFKKSVLQRLALGAVGAAAGGALGKVGELATGSTSDTPAYIAATAGAFSAPGLLDFIRKSAANPATRAWMLDLLEKSLRANQGATQAATTTVRAGASQQPDPKLFSDFAARFQ